MKLTGYALFPLGLAWVALACSTPAKVPPPASPAKQASPGRGPEKATAQPAKPALPSQPATSAPPALSGPGGAGLKPVFSVEKSALDLGMVKEGDDAMATFVVKNTGSAPLKILRATPG